MASLEGFGECVSGFFEFGKASDRAKAKEHRPQGIPVNLWWGALSMEKLDRCSKVIIGSPIFLLRALIKR